MQSGYSHIELARGRGLALLFDPEQATPGQMTSSLIGEDLRDHHIRALALRSHLMARHDMDLRSDFGKRLLPSQGRFYPGESVFYWQR